MSKFCQSCGKENPDDANVCSSCGKMFNVTNNANQGTTVNVNVAAPSNSFESPKSRLVTFLLCTFLGGLGIHRFYVGKVGTGILWFFTLGCFGIGVFVDWIMILCGSFKDNTGRVISNWNA